MNRALVQWLMDPDAPDEPLELADFLNRPSWQTRALCRGQGHEAFIKGDRADYTAAKLVCAACPVTEECLAYALEHSDLVGCFGGTDERERRVLRKAVA